MILGRAEYDIPVYFEVIVHHDVAHSFDLFPRQFSMLRLQFLRDAPRRFADHHVAVDMRLQRRIAVEHGAIGWKVLNDDINRIENVMEAQTIGPQTGTASRCTIWPKRPLRAPSETTSTFMPSISRKSI